MEMNSIVHRIFQEDSSCRPPCNIFNHFYSWLLLFMVTSDKLAVVVSMSKGVGQAPCVKAEGMVLLAANCHTGYNVL